MPVIRRRLLGEGLLDRARSTSIGLFALTTGVGLALVGVAVNQSWQVLPKLPIPAAPFERGADLDAREAVSTSTPAPGLVRIERARAFGSSGTEAAGDGGRDRRSGRPAVQEVSAPVSVTGRPVSQQPAGEPVVTEPGGAAAPPAAESAPVAVAPPSTSSPTTPSSGGDSKGRALGRSRGGSDQGGGGPPHSDVGSQAADPAPSDESDGEEKGSGPPWMDRGEGDDPGNGRGRGNND